MPVARQCRVEARETEIVFRKRGCRTHDPARFGRTCIGVHAKTQKHRAHAVAFGREHQPSRGGKIERLVVAIDLDHHRAQSGAGQRIARRLQRILRVIDAQKDEFRRIDAQFEQAAAIDLAMFERGEFLPYPQKRTARAKPVCEPRRETGSRRAVSSLRRINLVQRLASQTPQHLIGARMAQRDASQIGLGPLQRLPERGQ